MGRGQPQTCPLCRWGPGTVSDMFSLMPGVPRRVSSILSLVSGGSGTAFSAYIRTCPGGGGGVVSGMSEMTPGCPETVSGMFYLMSWGARTVFSTFSLVLGGPRTISSMSAVIPGEPGTVIISSMSTLTPRGPGIVSSNTMDTDSALTQCLFRCSGEKISFSSKVFCNCMPCESVIVRTRALLR